MPGFKTIVAATDFSAAGNRAVETAFGLATAADGTSGANVILLHVLQPVSPPNPLYAHYETGGECARERSEKVTCELERLIPPQVRRAVDVQIRVPEGHVAEQIVAVAEKARADAIIMGAPRRMGRAIHAKTVVDAVVQTAPCPVVVAH